MKILSYETGPFEKSIVYSMNQEKHVFFYPLYESDESAYNRLVKKFKSEKEQEPVPGEFHSVKADTKRIGKRKTAKTNYNELPLFRMAEEEKEGQS